MLFAPTRSVTYPAAFIICLCIESPNGIQIQPAEYNLSKVSRIDIPKFSDTNVESTLNFNSIKSNKTNVYRPMEKNEKILTSDNIAFANPVNHDQEVHKVNYKDLNEFALEGGGVGIPLQNSSVKSQDDGDFDKEFHSKGSKGRKGVKLPSSSVVPRKGVSVAADLLDDHQSNYTTTIPRPIEAFINSSLVQNNTETTLDSNMLTINSELTKGNRSQAMIQVQEPHIGIFNTTHSKKPKYVSDEKDVDDFDKYSIIKTSTTGEDYVIIGIVIVIGIWLSVFGALIFYRRAGEYWDRRHYRRMDFLVEGMYND